MKRCRALQRRDGDSPATPRRAERWELKTAASPTCTRPDGTRGPSCREPSRAQLYRLLYRPEDAARSSHARLSGTNRASKVPGAAAPCAMLR